MTGPDFLCIGAQKAGTTWLYDQLDAHPLFWMPPVKELKYLADRRGGHRRRLVEAGAADALEDGGVRAVSARVHDRRDRAFFEAARRSVGAEDRLAAYAALFRPKGALLSGDISPSYSAMRGEDVDRVAHLLPEARIVFLVRDPVERAWSQLAMLERRRRSPVALAAEDWPAIAAILSEPGVRRRSYPTVVAERWSKRFGQRFGLFFFDDIRDRPGVALARILSFLGVQGEEPGGLDPAFNRDAGNAKPPLPSSLRARLAELFAGELRACAAAFGGPAAEWPGRYGL